MSIWATKTKCHKLISFKQQKYIPQSSAGSEVKDQAASRFSVLLRGHVLTMVIFGLGLAHTWQKGWMSSLGMNLIHEGLLLWPNHPLKELGYQHVNQGRAQAFRTQQYLNSKDQESLTWLGRGDTARYCQALTLLSSLRCCPLYSSLFYNSEK